MKSKTIILFILAISGLTITFLFYWYQIRPSEIRKVCFDHIKGIYSFDNHKKSANNSYRQCLVSKGLEPASIFVNVEDDY